MTEPLFNAVLTPHRSLAPRGFLLVMGLLAALSFTAGLAFFLMGAWPVVGFMGLDVALVYIAFRLNYRHARQWERIVIRPGEASLERVDIYGRARRWSLPTAWLRVELEEPVEPSSRLALCSHGKRLTLGGFLPPQERADLAAALRQAVSAAKSSRS